MAEIIGRDALLVSALSGKSWQLSLYGGDAISNEVLVLIPKRRIFHLTSR
jgi:hypothetical protein